MKENKIENQNLKFEKRNDGDLFIVSGELESLKKIGVGFIENLENIHYFRNEEEKENFYNGAEQRPQGVFAVKFNKETLWLENRNGRGNSLYREQLQQAIDKIRSDLNL